MSSEDLDLERITGVCFLTIFSIIALMMGPLGLLFIIFAVLVFANSMKQKEAKKAGLSKDMKQEALTEGKSTVVKVDRRIIYQVPNKCPECGGSLSNEEVDWVGPLQAKCPFCRTTVEAQPTEF
jgi:hypothetical protein